MRLPRRLLLASGLILGTLLGDPSTNLSAQAIDSYAYDMGTPSVTDYYIDPTSGSDDSSGLSPDSAWRTVQHAWGQIPSGSTLTTGFRLNLMNGSYGDDELPNYWELKVGTAEFPIILRAAPGQSSVRFTRDINMANVSYFYLIGITIVPAGGGDAFHCEACDHLLIRGCTLNGGSTTNGAHETLKVNQSQYVFIENNNIAYADDNNIDLVGVQYGHIIGNRVHEASDWCAYVKGGSAYIRVEANEFFNCGTGGFTAGQGSGFQFMTSPWIHYEAYDIKVINNVIHDTEGAALGVNGGYNILLAHNTAYNVGARDHLLEIVFGERTCDGESDGQAESSCFAYNAAGGWGPSTVRTTPEPVGNRNVFVLNNVFINPSTTSAAQQFAIYRPRTPSGDVNLSAPQRADTNLVIAGNLIWNGEVSTPLGIGDEEGCQDSNPTCNASQLDADNSINVALPELRDPTQDDFRPSEGSTLLGLTPASLQSFLGGDRPSPPSIPVGVLSNSFTRDFAGEIESGPRVIGAFNSSDTALRPLAIDGFEVPEDPDPLGGEAPVVRGLSVATVRNGARVVVRATVRVTSSETVDSVTASIQRRAAEISSFALRAGRNGRYRGRRTLRIPAGRRLSIVVTAQTSGGSASKRKRFLVP